MNIFQNRLNQMATNQKQNQFKHTIQIITRKAHRIIEATPFQFQTFNFNGNLHSDKIEKEKFTNYIRSYGENRYYQILTTLFDQLYYDHYNLLKEFELEENNYSEISPATQRLKRIIMEVNQIPKIENVPEINELIPAQFLKQEEKRYQGIRLFVHISENGSIDLYLIDLYHLGIDAYNATTGQHNLNRNYKSNEDCKKCISKIADKYIEN